LTDLADYQWLVSDEANRWVAGCAGQEPSPRMQKQLRKELSSERARLVAEQAILRQKAVKKFGDIAAQMFFTEIGLQQATDTWVAAHKATRFRADQPIIDYCCGVGGDLLALAGRSPMVGWDRAPEITIFARANLRAWQREADVRTGLVEEHPPQPDEQWHLDPDRRVDGRRSIQFQWHSPSEEIIQNWLQRSSSGAIKLAPAAELSAEWQESAELEWISRDRECRQQVAWLGALAQSPGKRCATLVTTETHASFVGEPDVPTELADAVGAYVYDTDTAIRAARLTGAIAESLQCHVLTPGESYLTADYRAVHALISCFLVLEVMALRTADLIKHINALQIGELEIKTRGVAVRPEELRKKVKLSGSKSLTLLLTRHGKKEIAILAERQT
jgi:hypothetical protein